MSNEQDVLLEAVRNMVRLGHSFSIALRGHLSPGDYNRFARAELKLRVALRDYDAAQKKPEPAAVAAPEPDPAPEPPRRKRKVGGIAESLDEVLG